MPWAALLFLAAGVLVARRKVVALIWAAVALALAMAIVLAALAIGNIVFVASVSPATLPSNVAAAVYATVVGVMQTLGIAILVLAVAVAIVTWFAGPFTTPRRLRGFFGSGVTWVREAAERHGITTGRTGVWLYRQRVLLRVAVAVVASLVILLVRPLTAGVIIWTLVLVVVVVVILELLQRPVAEAVPEATAGTPLPAA